MRGKPLWAIVAGSIVVLLAVIYFGVHSPRPRANVADTTTVAEPAAPAVTESTTVEPTEERVKTADTRAQAPAHEPAVAVAQQADSTGSSFRDLRQCVYASRELVTAKHVADCKFYEGKPEYQAAFAECLDEWGNAQNRIGAAEAALSECNQADMGTRYFKATKEAAKRGDVDAQLCYLQGDFFSPEGAQIFTDAELEEYKTHAPRYVDAALKRGDWRVVDLLNTQHFHPGSGPVHLIDGVGDRDTQYKMTKLLRLGASGSYADFLDGRLEDMMHPDLDPSAALPPEVIKKGDAWARQTYIDYFAGVPGLTKAPVVCSPEPGRPGSLPDLTNADAP